MLDKGDGFYLNRVNTYGEVNTLFNGSEANRGVSSICPESPTIQNVY